MRGPDDFRVGAVSSHLIDKIENFVRPWCHQNHFLPLLAEVARADFTNATGGTDDHGRTLVATIGCPFNEIHALESIAGGPKSGRCRKRISGCHRNRRTVRDRHSGIADDLCISTEANDAGAAMMS
jgi:hypothetical protein